jgi:hypothetical protein
MSARRWRRCGSAAKGRCIGPTYPVELPLAQQFSNRPDHRVFLRTALVLLGLSAHGQPQLGAFAGMTRPTVLAHSDAGIALHTSLPRPERYSVSNGPSPRLLPAAGAASGGCSPRRYGRRYGRLAVVLPPRLPPDPVGLAGTISDTEPRSCALPQTFCDPRLRIGKKRDSCPRILSPLRLPFRHVRRGGYSSAIPSCGSPPRARISAFNSSAAAPIRSRSVPRMTSVTPKSLRRK